MTISNTEKRIIFQILVLIMKADQITKDEEVRFLDRLFDDFGLSIDLFDHMENLDSDILKKEFSQLSDDVKVYARKLFIEMAECDGFLDPREINIIENFG